MTRNRINIDVDPHLLKWIDLTATIVGANRTETARALLKMMSESNPRYDTLKTRIAERRAEMNQSRSQHQSARHRPRQQSPQ